MLDLNFTKDPQWRRQRESLWKKKEAFLRDEFTKKELEVYRRYFMDGELTTHKDFSVNDVAKILYFPLKTPEAWEYLTQNVLEGRTNPQDPEGYNGFLQGMVTTVIQRMDRSGWTYEEQCVLFTWLLSDEFKPKITTKVPIGPKKLCPTLVLDPDDVFQSAVETIYFWLYDAVIEFMPVMVSKMGYLISLIPKVDQRFFDVELHDNFEETKAGLRIRHTQRKFHKILEWMKSYEPNEEPNGPIESHQRFLADFKLRLDALEPKPGQLAILLEQLAH